MSRYIDAEWLKQNFNTVFWSQITKTIDSAPSIDAVSEWIPCSERLPDKDVEVLVDTYNGTMQVCSVTTYKGTLVWEDVYGYWHGIEAFDAWMPLPKPYGERKENE